MHEEFALQYADRRAKEKGYHSYRVVYREFVIPANEKLKFQAYNEVWLMTYISWGMQVISDYGRYNDTRQQGIVENSYEHADVIEIINSGKAKGTIRFLQVILKTRTDGTPHKT
ncbi:hypothetical protein [Aquimarina longa]|uniref:hypothetical protein n=1 Tax=Aquimarina longa TaxID=1080221 RepID=UPI00078357B0|nr:hypothetical protein [Aquimarina longa]